MSEQANTAFTSSRSIIQLHPNDQRRAIVTTTVRPAWRDGTARQLQDLVRLDQGWDGYRGKPTLLENAYFAIRMMEACCTETTPAPHIVPGPDGDLQLEWHAITRKIELHVRAPNDVVAWHSDAATGPDGFELLLTIDFSEVLKWMVKLAGDSSAAATAAA